MVLRFRVHLLVFIFSLLSDDKIISAKEAYTKEGRFEPESGRQTRQVRDQLHNREVENDDEMPYAPEDDEA